MAQVRQTHQSVDGATPAGGAGAAHAAGTTREGGRCTSSEAGVQVSALSLEKLVLEKARLSARCLDPWTCRTMQKPQPASEAAACREISRRLFIHRSGCQAVGEDAIWDRPPPTQESR